MPIRLPAHSRSVSSAPEIISSTLDEHATHVYSRSTPTRLAVYDEHLEGDARRAAEGQMRNKPSTPGSSTGPAGSAERTVGGLLRSLGYEHVDIAFRDVT